jgi:hypothetical protein
MAFGFVFVNVCFVLAELYASNALLNGFTSVTLSCSGLGAVYPTTRNGLCRQAIPGMLMFTSFQVLPLLSSVCLHLCFCSFVALFH